MTIFRALASAILLSLAIPAWGDLSIGDGGSFSLGSGVLRLADTPLIIDGEFDLGSGNVERAGNILISGVFSGGSGSLSTSGDWINNGTFNAMDSAITLFDETGSTALVLGDSVFYGLSIFSSAAGEFVFESGSIQNVTDSLFIQGVSGLPLQLRSTSPLQIAQLFLENGASQDIAFLGVSDVHATGQPLAPDQTNQGGTGNDLGWFGRALEFIPIPTLSVPGLIVLVLAIFGVAVVRRKVDSQFVA